MDTAILSEFDFMPSLTGDGGTWFAKDSTRKIIVGGYVEFFQVFESVPTPKGELHVYVPCSTDDELLKQAADWLRGTKNRLTECVNHAVEQKLANA